MSKNSLISLLTILLCFSVIKAEENRNSLPHPDLLSPEILSQVESATAAAAGNKSGDTVQFICTDLTFTSPSGGGNDCWGWVDGSGNQYAIYGSHDAVEFYNTTTGTYVDKVEAPGCTWRDMKTYGNYCYSVSECGGTNEGMIIIDMSYLPDSVHYVKSVFTSNSATVTSHNVWIDTVAGFLYLEGSGTSGDAVRIFGLTDPETPQFIGSLGPGGTIHDMYAMNDTLYIAEGNNHTFSIWDVSNKNSPNMLTRVNVPNSGYVHNIWPTDDRNYCVTTEETAFKTVKFWDISDLNNVQLVSEYLGSSNLAHNAQILGDTVYISHYESGVSIVDITDKNNPSLVYEYDNYPGGNAADFNGCWGVYQYTPNGEFYASNMEGTINVVSLSEAILADTIYALTPVFDGVDQVRIDIFASFSQPTRTITFPFDWSNGPIQFQYDSVSTVGHMTEDFEIQGLNAYAFTKAAFTMTSSVIGTQPDIPGGTSGIIASVFLTVTSGSPGDENEFTFAPVNGKISNFSTPCLAYEPDTVSTVISLTVPTCCIGIRGNVDGDINDQVDISDILYMVDFMFQNPAGPAPVCDIEADVNADTQVDIADLLYMVDYSFSNPAGPAPASCL